eukprot:1380579-Pyramimonas_sp.AAC.1
MARSRESHSRCAVIRNGRIQSSDQLLLNIGLFCSAAQVLYDCGVVTTKEPFQRLVNQGMILGEVEYSAGVTEDGSLVSAETPGVSSTTRVPKEDVDATGATPVLKSDSSVKLAGRAFKMSKSRGNVINPDDVITDYGADSLRLYEMFMGPLRETKVRRLIIKGVEHARRGGRAPLPGAVPPPGAEQPRGRDGARRGAH